MTSNNKNTFIKLDNKILTFTSIFRIMNTALVDKINSSLLGLSLLGLSFALLTSADLMILSFGLLGLASTCFIFKMNWRTFNLSSWALVGFFIAIQLSLYANAQSGYWNLNGIFRGGLYLLSVLFIVPLSWYFFKNELQHKKIKILLYVLCIGALIATIYGLFNLYSDYGFTKMKIKTRNSGIFYEPIPYAQGITLCLIILIGLIIHRYKKVSLRFLIITGVILLCGLYTAYSRGSWLSFLCAVPFLLLPNRKLFFSYLMLSVGVGACLYFIEKKQFHRTNTSVRSAQWEASLQIAKKKPLLGNGFLSDVTSNIPEFQLVADTVHKIGGMYNETLQEFTNRGLLYNRVLKKHKGLHGVQVKENLGDHVVFNYKYSGSSHNDFFQTLANTGIIGSFFFITWIVLWFFEMYKRKDIIARITLALIVCFVVGGMTQSMTTIPEYVFFLMIVYAISQVDRKHVEQIINKSNT